MSWQISSASDSDKPFSSRAFRQIGRCIREPIWTTSSVVEATPSTTSTRSRSTSAPDRCTSSSSCLAAIRARICPVSVDGKAVGGRPNFTGSKLTGSMKPPRLQ